MLEATISKSIRKLGDQMVADGHLRDYVPYLFANRGPLISSGEDGSAGPTVPSKYDHFLDGVVVIAAGSGVGSGFVVSRDGYVITNKHVVTNDKFVRIKFRSGQILVGTVVDDSTSQDLALVKLSGDGFSALGLSTGVDAAVGNDVLAIGTPKGLSWSVTKGIVSAVRDLGGVRLIQTDAAINTGNSGGPLIDLQTGQVIGVNTLIYRKDLSEGLNFAVSADAVWEAFGRRLNM